MYALKRYRSQFNNGRKIIISTAQNRAITTTTNYTNNNKSNRVEKSVINNIEKKISVVSSIEDDVLKSNHIKHKSHIHTHTHIPTYIHTYIQAENPSAVKSENY